MVRRCYLTEELMESLVAPEQGETWISDTAIRGFGVRLWRHNGKASKAYALRVTTKDGRSVRRTFDPYGQANMYLRLWGEMADENGEYKTSAFLQDARAWATLEIQRLRGHLPTLAEERAAENEYQKMRHYAGAYLERKTLEHLVELVLSNGKARGWTQDYRDRLRRAFNNFDPTDKIRSRTIDDLSDGSLSRLIEESGISPGNLRLLRSLLNVTLRNVHDLGGPPIGRLLPDRRNLRSASGTSKEEEFVASIDREDIKRLLSRLEGLPFNWRSRTCIEACILFRPPPARDGRTMVTHSGRQMVSVCSSGEEDLVLALGSD